jgi:hypothetical protein
LTELKLSSIVKSNKRKEIITMADLKVIKKVGSVEGQSWEAYYLIFDDHGIKVELKLRANSTEKQHLENIVQNSLKK